MLQANNFNYSKASPPIEIETLRVPNGAIYVVRDDQLPGGTKQRAAVPFLENALAEGFHKFVYASPFSGFAQVALAASCQKLNAPCILFCEADPQSANPMAHEFTRLAQSYGATVHLCGSLEQAESQAATYRLQNPSCLKIPLGFNTPYFKICLQKELERQWPILCQKIQTTPRRVWVPVGSGTLAHVFRQVVPESTQLICVDVHVLSSRDERLENVRRLSRIEYLPAPEAFCQPVRTPPPIASNRYYDAKLWQFLLERGQAGDIWWNVAR